MVMVMKLVLSVAVLCAVGRLAAADGPVAAKPSGTNAPAPARSGAAATAAALRSFRVKPGFRVDLVASEPLVTQPVAMAFDENGRLFVLEKPDDPAVGGLPFSRVRVLEDADGDGVYDASGVYADNLTNATALVCYGGGVFVAAAGRILYLKDSKADGTADEQREVFKSFGDATNGQRGQVIITGLAWGPDNRIHASTAGRGGDVISGSSPNQSVILTGGNFSFDPRTSLLSVESGSAAAGIGFDSRGRAFISSLRGHLEMIMYEARYAARNPYCEPPPAMQDLESPAELAARAGASALSPGTNSANNLFAIGRGLAIYQGTAFPADYGGDAFVVDVAGETGCITLNSGRRAFSSARSSRRMNPARSFWP
jgi:putative membrane-bound dehydrogenase-like protein